MVDQAAPVDLNMYDPRLASLLETCDDDWGDPAINRNRLVPYGIKVIDQALYGIDLDGEFILLQGEQKGRKSTVAANVVVSINMGEKPAEKPVIAIESLESGMRPKKYRDFLISMVATQHLYDLGHTPTTRCPVCNDEQCHHIGISPKFLRYNTRTPLQQKAIQFARDTMEFWPVLLFGAPIGEGNTRSLSAAVKGNKGTKGRWLWLKEEYGAEIIIVDHIQQFAFETELTDYEKQLRAVAAMGDFSAQYNMTFLALSQVSQGSIKEARDNGAKLVAAGGAKAAQEANTVLTSSYKSGSGIAKLRIEESRYAANVAVYQRLDDVSGRFFGDASTEPFVL